MSLNLEKVPPPTSTTRCKRKGEEGSFTLFFFRMGGFKYFIILLLVFFFCLWQRTQPRQVPAFLLHLVPLLLPSFPLSSVHPHTSSLLNCSLFNCKYKNVQMLPFDGAGHSWRFSDDCRVTQLWLKAFSSEKIKEVCGGLARGGAQGHLQPWRGGDYRSADSTPTCTTSQVLKQKKQPSLKTLA